MFDRHSSRMIAALKKQIEDYDAFMGASVITSTPFILKIGGLYVTPEFKDGKTTGKMELSANPLTVMGFAREDAENLAPTITNGHGDRGRAVGRYAAVVEARIIAVDLIAQLEKLAEVAHEG